MFFLPITVPCLRRHVCFSKTLRTLRGERPGSTAMTPWDPRFVEETPIWMWRNITTPPPTSPPHLLDSAVGVEDNRYLFFSNILVIKMTMANMFFYVKQDQKKTKSDNLLKSW